MVAAFDMRWRVERGDSLSLVRAIPDDTIDALITDPPYSSGGMWKRDKEGASSSKYLQSVRGGGHEGLANFEGDNRDQRSFLAWASLWMAEAHRAAKEGAVCIVFSDWRQLPVMSDAVQAGNWIWRGVAVWDKLTGRPSRGRFTSQAEYILWGSKGRMPEEDVYLPGVFPIPFVRVRHRHHPTEKSLRLMRRLVQVTTPGGLILDPFSGSGTTGAAALLEGRRYLGFELSKQYSVTSSRRCEWAERMIAEGKQIAPTVEIPEEVDGEDDEPKTQPRRRRRRGNATA